MFLDSPLASFVPPTGEPPCAAASTSSLVILPPGPVPLIALRSTPNSVAYFFAIGLAFTFTLLDEETDSGFFST